MAGAALCQVSKQFYQLLRYWPLARSLSSGFQFPCCDPVLFLGATDVPTECRSCHVFNLFEEKTMEPWDNEGSKGSWEPGEHRACWKPIYTGFAMSICMTARVRVCMCMRTLVAL